MRIYSRRPAWDEVRGLVEEHRGGGHRMDGTRRADIQPGSRVSIVLKKDQRTGRRTEGIVKDILTKSPAHPHGMKVRLEGGDVGRVKEILD